MSKSPVSITACYKFLPFAEEKLSDIQNSLKEFGAARGIRGLVLLATEGINGTVSGSAEAIAEWKACLIELCGELEFKDSFAEGEVFLRWHVKVRPEIVTIKQDDIHPQGLHNHLTPAEWNKMLEEEDVVVLDARNDYEVAVGKFKGAIDPKIRSFHEFPEYVKNAAIPKEKKVLMYCTGGIRCDKAIFAMKNEGYQNVYQLQGGILKYLEEFPEDKFEGECFVFDHRVAVDQHLKPSEKFGLCPHCGDPGNTPVVCVRCNGSAKLCQPCLGKAEFVTCSKNCDYQYKIQKDKQKVTA